MNRANPRSIPLCEPWLPEHGRELEYLSECVRTGWVSHGGPYVRAWEEAFGRHHHALAVSTTTGTAALHLALRLVGVRPGDLVMVPAFSFVATANVVLYLGAEPEFVDAETRTWNMDPEALEAAIDKRIQEGRRPAAILVAHIYGQPARMDRIVEVARKHGIPLVEDAAEALGARFLGRLVGTFGEIGCFSFNGNKLITSGQGGMVLTREEALAAHAAHLATQARPDSFEYFHDELGFNYRLSNIQAAVGLAQFERLGECLEAKKATAEFYRAALADVPGIAPPPPIPGIEPSHWMATALVDERAFGMDARALMKALVARGIGVRPFFMPMHRLPAFERWPAVTPVADRIFRDGLCLPCSVGLSEPDRVRVVHEIRDLSPVGTGA